MAAGDDRGNATFPVVALVASKGGLAAVTAVLEPLPEDLQAGIIVLIHQEPDRVSELPQILRSRCALPVSHAQQDEPLRAGHVLVAPPGKHLLVTPRGEAALVTSGIFPPNRPSADLLLTSMALSLEERAVAVVLSGGGHDGATGATVVHDFGGSVFASDEASSEEFSMPQATIGRDDAVDGVLPVAEMAARLRELIGGA